MQRAWVHTLTDPWVADAATWRPLLAGERCSTEEAFLATAARVLTFPSYFGANWDAFDECLIDLLDVREGGIGSAFGATAGRPEQRVQLVIRSPELVLRDASPRALAVLVHALRNAARRCASGPGWAAFGLTLTGGDDEPDVAAWCTAGLTPGDMVNGRTC